MSGARLKTVRLGAAKDEGMTAEEQALLCSAVTGAKICTRCI